MVDFKFGCECDFSHICYFFFLLIFQFEFRMDFKVSKLNSFYHSIANFRLSHRNIRQVVAKYKLMNECISIENLFPVKNTSFVWISVSTEGK